jgi:hypothetical protein
MKGVKMSLRKPKTPAFQKRHGAGRISESAWNETRTEARPGSYIE